MKGIGMISHITLIVVASFAFLVPFIQLISTIPYLIAICNSLFAIIMLSLIIYFLFVALWLYLMIYDKKKADEQENDYYLIGNNEDMEIENNRLLSNNNNTDDENPQTLSSIDEQQQQPREQQKQQNKFVTILSYSLRALSILLFFAMVFALLGFAIYIAVIKSRAEGLFDGKLSLSDYKKNVQTSESLKKAYPYVEKVISSLDKYSQDVIVERDENGVIHITAPDETSLFWTQGFIHAQERLWQLDTLKRTVRGELSEIFGDPSIFSDKYYRTMGLYDAAKRDVNLISDDLKQRLQSYVDGINFYVTTLPGLPLEYQLMDYRPTLFTLEDILANHKYFSLTLSGNSHMEMLRYQLEKNGITQDRINTLLPFDYPTNYPTVLNPTLTNKQTKSLKVDAKKTLENLYESLSTSILQSIPKQIANLFGAANDLINFATSPTNAFRNMFISELKLDPQYHFTKNSQMSITPHIQASNSWVLKGSHTSSKKPIHSNDIHLHFQTPNMFLLMHLKIVNNKDGVNTEVIGGSMIGAPSIIVGRNGKGVSWSFSNAGADTQDLYVVKQTNDGLGYVLSDGTIKKYEIQSVSLKVAGRKTPVVFNIIKTEYGPLVDDLYVLLYPLSSTYKVAIRNFGIEYKGDQSLQTFLDLPNVSSFAEFRASFTNYVAPVLNVIYADNKDNIGYLTAGKLPKRVDEAKGNRGLKPVKSYLTTEATFTWEKDATGSFVSVSQDEPLLNPTAGFIFSANNKITDKVTVSNDYSLTYGRTLRINEQLNNLIASTKNQVTIKHIRDLQLDSTSQLFLQNKNIFQQMKPFDDAYAEEMRKEFAAKWDGKIVVDSKKATIFEYWLKYLTALPGMEVNQTIYNFVPFHMSNHSFPPSLRYVFNSIQNEIQNPNNKDQSCVKYSPDKTCLGFASQQFLQVLKDLRKQFSFIPAYSSYRIHQTKFTHPLLGNSNFGSCIGNRVSRRAGGTDTISEAGGVDSYLSNDFGPTYRQIIDHLEPENSLFIIPLGQSGNVFSRLYDSYLMKWENGDYIPMKTKNYKQIETLSISTK